MIPSNGVPGDNFRQIQPPAPPCNLFGISLTSRNRDILFGVLLAVLTFLAYQPAWNGTPVLDDSEFIVKPGAHTLHRLIVYWTQPGATFEYLPVLFSSFWVQYLLWGSSPLGYHLTNVVLHLIAVFLLLILLRRLQVKGAWLAAAIFALHPVQVESVAWIAEQKNTMSTVLFFGALLSWLEFDRIRSRRLYALALFLFVLGMLSKPSVLPLPAAALALIWWKRGSLEWKRDLMPFVPFLFAGIFLSIITVVLEITHLKAKGAAFAIPLAGRCIIAGKVFWFYLAKIFRPDRLTAMYPRWNPGIGAAWQFVFPAAALLCGAALWMLRRRRPELLTTYIYYAAMLTPVMGFVNIACFRYTFVADRWQHLACAGPIVLASSWLAVLMETRNIPLRRLVQVFSAAIVLFFGIVSFEQAGMYKSGEAFYRGIVARNPSAGMAWNNLGVELLQRGASGEAAVAFQKAIDNNYDDAYFNFSIQYYFDNGRRLIQAGRREEAIALFRKAVQFYPGNSPAYEVLGSLYAQAGNPDAAIDNYRRAVAIAPATEVYRRTLGMALMKSGRFGDAVDQFKAAVEADPGNPYCLANLAEAYFHLGKQAEAVRLAGQGFELARREGENKIAAELHDQVELYISVHDKGTIGK